MGDILIHKLNFTILS